MKKLAVLMVVLMSVLAFADKKGTIKKDAIQETINKKLSDIRGCYEQQVKKKPSLAGKLVVDFVIGLDGELISIKFTENTLHDSIVETCVAYQLTKLKFPKPGGGVVNIVYPFTFSVKK